MELQTWVEVRKMEFSDTASAQGEEGFSLENFSSYILDKSNWELERGTQTCVYREKKRHSVVWEVGERQGGEADGRGIFSATTDAGHIFTVSIAVNAGLGEQGPCGLLTYSSPSPSPLLPNMLQGIIFATLISKAPEKFLLQVKDKLVIKEGDHVAHCCTVPRLSIPDLPQLSSAVGYPDLSDMQRLSPASLFTVITAALTDCKVTVSSSSRDHTAAWLHSLCTAIQPFSVSPFSSNPTKEDLSILREFPSGFLVGVDDDADSDFGCVHVDIDTGTVKVSGGEFDDGIQCVCVC